MRCCKFYLKRTLLKVAEKRYKMNLKQQLDEIIRQLSTQGFNVRDLIFEPPCNLAEIQTVEEALGFVLPPSFRETLLTISAHIEFRWFAPDDIEFPEPFSSIFSGDLHWSIHLIKQFNDDKNSWVKEVFPDVTNSYDAVWHNKLAFYEVGNGDYLTIDLNPESYEQIVYLSHDDGEGHGHVIAENFQELIRRWVPLACPGGEAWQWLPFANDLTTPIDPTCPNAKTWSKLLQVNYTT
jgi:cell wall assembly regulator SMI1